MTRKTETLAQPKHGDIGYVIRWNGKFVDGDFEILHHEQKKNSALLKSQELAFAFSILKIVEDVFLHLECGPAPITWLSTVRFIESDTADGERSITPYALSFEPVEPLSRSQMKKLGLVL